MEGNITRQAVALVTALTFTVGGGGVVADAAASGADEGRATVATSQVLAAGVAARSRVRRTTARWAGSINVYNRAAVNAAYWRDYAAGLSTPTGYTGDVDSCNVGGTSAESQAATLRAINYVRSLSGLYPVSFNATLNARSQYTALMMSANKTLSHHPTSNWRCYTGTGAANAGRSNLALAYPSLTSAGLVGMYMKELGSSNYAVGHRRWLLNPFSIQMGSGATNTANAITVIGPTSMYRPNPAWVSWPSMGYFPDTLEPNGRWSLSAGDRRMNFKNARVRVYRNGALVQTVKNPVANGYAMPTIVWQMPASISKSGSFKVVVSGIRKGKRKKVTRTYGVAMFTPSQ